MINFSVFLFVLLGIAAIISYMMYTRPISGINDYVYKNTGCNVQKTEQTDTSIYCLYSKDNSRECGIVSFDKKPSKEEILKLWKDYKGRPQELSLPSAPKQFLTYFEEDNRPQTGLDRNIEKGMGITIGRLREDNIFDYKFVCLSHNTIRGAAGGAVLTAELLRAEGYLTSK